MESNMIIIGAGAAGLMAARTLALAGNTVTVLEARNRTGGRINTISNTSFFTKAELGAEFIHGDLPVTLDLLKEADIATQPFDMQTWRYRDGQFRPEEEQVEHWDIVMQKLAELEQDQPIAQFMRQHFGDERYVAVTRSVLQFVAGYDTADPEKAGAFALRKEWQAEVEGAQHHIPDGYCAMIGYLSSQIKTNGGTVHLGAEVTDIYHAPGDVRVVTSNGDTYQAQKLIVALPLGVLQQGAVKFHPPVPKYQAAFKHIGFGSIIKILFQFDTAFWEDELGISGTSFLFTDEAIPTWWTQGNGDPLLTGWLGGNPALALKNAPDDELYQLGLTSLANAFHIDIELLKGKLTTWRVANWTADPYTRGSYAYDMIGSDEARKVISQPINDTVFFAGEYLYDGPAMGTVEAALNSGVNCLNR
ncbi:flavin monoamine oxidase family protein [Mucilaginibacter myungsuensis]|uniref:Tryptophan 2-monooxygenase n=1 Tax=Mucilaginibacter myungsuensis TaxID=649104 RepID=A0A929PWC8_9SPHI|nr:NAD(P)/FAD-dependent oxidoreductase [Mucilaginibacter myungsuensis]MBE9661999.1 FAD-dependent oxidoreductase [Mucilaginibacter myungsuensis]MDN3599568.1 NAD(P)/FAD-dependent oxidoreductase [Mucilaginibacter myungsuensis]